MINGNMIVAYALLSISAYTMPVDISAKNVEIHPRTGQNVCMMSTKDSAGFAQHTYSVCIPIRSKHAENAGIHPSKNPRVNTIDQRDTAKNAWVRLPLNIRKRFVTTTYRKIIAGFAPPTDFALITGAYTCVLYAWELEYVFTKG